MPRAKKEAITKVCLYCLKEYSTTRSKSTYCTRECKEQHALIIGRQKTAEKQKKRLLSKSELFDKTPFARYLVTETKRAKTLEILRDITAEELLQLLQLTRNRTSYSGITSGSPGNSFHLSHIFPVSGNDRVGLLSPTNLVISPAEYNQRRRNKIPLLAKPDKYSISRSSLDKKYSVSATEPFSTVLLKLKRYLGASVLNEFYRAAKLTKTQYNIFKDKLIKLGYSEKALKNLSKEQLQQLLQTQGVSTSSSFSRDAFSSIEVCKAELERTGNKESVLYWICEALVAQRYDFCNSIAWSLDYPINKFIDYIVEQTNHLLHLEPYKLDIDGRHLILFFSIREESMPSNKLEEVLRQRQQYNKTRKANIYYDYNDCF